MFKGFEINGQEYGFETCTAMIGGSDERADALYISTEFESGEKWGAVAWGAEMPETEEDALAILEDENRIDDDYRTLQSVIREDLPASAEALYKSGVRWHDYGWQYSYNLTDAEECLIREQLGELENAT